MNINTIINIIKKRKENKMTHKNYKNSDNKNNMSNAANKEKKQIGNKIETTKISQNGGIDTISINASEDHTVTNKKAELPIDSTIKHLESVISHYKKLDQKVHNNKNKITDLQKNTIRIRKNKKKIEGKISENNEDIGIEIAENSQSNVIVDSNLIKEIVDNKYMIKNKTCHTIKQQVEKIQSHITTNTKKSASYIEPLYLSCKLLKTHVLYTQSLESTVEAFNIQRELELQQDDANELIKMLVEHFNAIKDYQPLSKTSETHLTNTIDEKNKKTNETEYSNEQQQEPLLDISSKENA